MKKILLSSLVAAAAAMPAFAGVDNINYQAVIKNGTSVVANEKVTLKFELLDKAETPVYSEVQYVTTNAAGLVSCQLGTENDLTTLEWGDLNLRVSIDLGSGYQVISNETVSSVPTALYALKSADSDEIKEAVEELMLETELNKETILGINAEIVKLEGLTEEFATLEQVDQFATMNEARLDKMQNQIDAADKAIEENYDDLKGSIMRNEQNISVLQGKVNADFDNLGENLDNLVIEMNAKLEEVNGQLENLNLVSAVVRVNEEAIEELQQNQDDLKGSIMRNEQAISVLQGKVNEDFDNLGENLDNLVIEMNTKLEEVNGQLENLNNVSAVVRANEEAIEELQGDFKNLGENLDNLVTEMNAKFDEVNGQLENLNNVSAVVRANEEAIEELQGDFKNLGENLDNLVTEMNAKFDEVNGQLENLNNVSAVVRANEEAIEETIMPAVEELMEDNGEIKSKLLSMGADLAQIEGLAAKVETLEDSMAAIASPSDPDSMMNQVNAGMADIQSQVDDLKYTLDQLIEALQQLDIIPTTFKASK